MSDQHDRKNLIEGNGHFLIWLGFFCLILILATGFGMWLLSGENSQLPWMVVALGGFSILAVFLYSGSVLFRIFGLHDASQAMGLPRNSVRSLLTFLIFTILMAFIFYSTHLLRPSPFELKVYTFPKDQLSVQQDRISKLGNIIDITTQERAIKNEAGDPIKDATGEIQTELVVILKVEQSATNPVAFNQMREYLERILIALLSISSSIIGFYFGSRTGEGRPVSDDNVVSNQPAAPKPPEPSLPPTPPEGFEWSLTTPTASLVKQPDGFIGRLSFTSDEIPPDNTFNAIFVPTEGALRDQPTDLAQITVDRVGNTLNLTIQGTEIEAQGIPDGAQIAVYPTDGEEQAKTVGVDVVSN